MRILTVRQPWARAIVIGEKDVENRSRNIAGDYRGPIAIHSARGKAADLNDAQLALLNKIPDPEIEWGLDGEGMVGGEIIGVVDLVGVHHSDLDGCGTGDAEGLIPLCSEWGEPISHHLVLANARLLAEPIPYRGALGLRKLDEETTARILEQIGTK